MRTGAPHKHAANRHLTIVWRNSLSSHVQCYRSAAARLRVPERTVVDDICRLKIPSSYNHVGEYTCFFVSPKISKIIGQIPTNLPEIVGKTDAINNILAICIVIFGCRWKFVEEIYREKNDCEIAANGRGYPYHCVIGILYGDSSVGNKFSVFCDKF